MDPPWGFDVPDAAWWFPNVSANQAVGDLLLHPSVPPGFGHDFATEYPVGWADMAPPDGWKDADTARLKEFLDDGEGEAEA